MSNALLSFCMSKHKLLQIVPVYGARHMKGCTSTNDDCRIFILKVRRFPDGRQDNPTRHDAQQALRLQRIKWLHLHGCQHAIL